MKFRLTRNAVPQGTQKGRERPRPRGFTRTCPDCHQAHPIPWHPAPSIRKPAPRTGQGRNGPRPGPPAALGPPPAPLGHRRPRPRSPSPCRRRGQSETRAARRSGPIRAGDRGYEEEQGFPVFPPSGLLPDGTRVRGRAHSHDSLQSVHGCARAGRPGCSAPRRAGPALCA